jgi:hypothetical protein
MFTNRVSVVIAQPTVDVFEASKTLETGLSGMRAWKAKELTSPERIRVGTTVRTTLRSIGRETG